MNQGQKWILWCEVEGKLWNLTKIKQNKTKQNDLFLNICDIVLRSQQITLKQTKKQTLPSNSWNKQVAISRKQLNFSITTMIYFSSTPLLLSYILSLVHMMKDLKLRSNIMCCHGICWNWGGLKCLNHKYPPHSVLINKDPLAKKKKTFFIKRLGTVHENQVVLGSPWKYSNKLIISSPQEAEGTPPLWYYKG